MNEHPLAQQCVMNKCNKQTDEDIMMSIYNHLGVDILAAVEKT